MMDTRTTSFADTQHRHFQRGLTIVELMVALALGLMVVAASLTVFANSSRTRNELQKSSQQNESGRYATQLLAADLSLAGYLAEFNPTKPTVYPAPGSVPDGAKVCSFAKNDLLETLPLHVQGIDDATGAELACLSDVKPNTDILVIRRVGECASNGLAGIAGTPGCEAFDAGNKWYFQASLCYPTDGHLDELARSVSTTADYATYRFSLGTAASDFKLHRMPDSKADPANDSCTDSEAKLADVHRYVVHIYFIANNNSAGDGIPTLKRAELGANALTVVPLVDGVEDMQIGYGVDGDKNGPPETWKAAPSTVAEWLDVTAVRVSLLARSNETSAGWQDTRTYNGFHNDLPFNDAYKRHVYTTTTQLANPLGRRL